MDFFGKIKFYEYLASKLSESRQALFEEKAQKRHRYLTLVLDNLSKSQNNSAIVRTADAFGLTDLYFLEKGPVIPDKINKNISKKSEKWLNVTKFNNEKKLVKTLHQKGYQVLCTTPDKKSPSLYDFTPSMPTAIVFGNEVYGTSKELINKADRLLTIPMKGFVESFNVSVSCGIILGALETKMTYPTLSEEEQLDLKILWAIKSLKKGQAISDFYFETLSRSK